jgi:hypothetical protein
VVVSVGGVIEASLAGFIELTELEVTVVFIGRTSHDLLKIELFPDTSLEAE